MPSLTGFIDISKLKFSDRKHECEIFRRILHRQIPYRGLIVHSNGQSRAGKSTLLTMFRRMCQDTTLPWRTTDKFFDARRFISWQEILDSTVTSLGEANFANYLQLRSGSGDSRKSGNMRQTGALSAVLTSTPSHQVDDLAHNSASDNKSGQSETIDRSISTMQENRFITDTPVNLKETRQQLTRTFLRELNNLPEQHQVVWLIDTAENLSPETHDWLDDLFWEIGESTTQRLILVVAGKEKLLSFHPAWSMYVQEIPIAFTVDVIGEIVSTILPNWDRADIQPLARTIYRVGKGDPMTIMMNIDIFIEEQGIVYGESSG